MARHVDGMLEVTAVNEVLDQRQSEVRKYVAADYHSDRSVTHPSTPLPHRPMMGCIQLFPIALHCLVIVLVPVRIDRASMSSDLVRGGTHSCLSVRAVPSRVGVRQVARKDLPSDT